MVKRSKKFEGRKYPWLSTILGSILIIGTEGVAAVFWAFILLLWIVFQQYRRFKIRQKTDANSLSYLHETPDFNRDLTDCYVQLSGVVSMPASQDLTTPIFKMPCDYFNCSIYGKRKVKAQKPSKGMKTVQNNVFEKKSAEDVEIKIGEDSVLCNPSQFREKGQCVLHEKSDDFYNLEPLNHLIASDSKHHSSYHVLERWLQNQDQVAVFGRLTNDQGRLRMIPTESDIHPSAFFLGNAEDIVHSYQMHLAGSQKKWIKISGFFAGWVGILLIGSIVKLL